MKNFIKIKIFILFVFIVFLRCSLFENRLNEKIFSQQLVYDSINNKSKTFNVTLETNIVFCSKDSSRIDYNELNLIINNNSYSLIPDIKSKKNIKRENKFVITFNSKVNFTSKYYKNDTLTNKVLNSKIRNKKGNFLCKVDSYELKSLILANPPTKKGLKLE